MTKMKMKVVLLERTLPKPLLLTPARPRPMTKMKMKVVLLERRKKMRRRWLHLSEVHL
jgi:hypothetical protein